MRMAVCAHACVCDAPAPSRNNDIYIHMRSTQRRASLAHSLMPHAMLLLMLMLAPRSFAHHVGHACREEFFFAKTGKMETFTGDCEKLHWKFLVLSTLPTEKELCFNAALTARTTVYFR